MVPIVGSAITIMICVVGVRRSMNALNAPVLNSNDKNSEFNFLQSVQNPIQAGDARLGGRGDVSTHN